MFDHDEKSMVCTEGWSAKQVDTAVGELLEGMCSIELLWFEAHLSDCLSCCLAVAQRLDVELDVSEPGLIGMVLLALDAFQQAQNQSGSDSPFTDYLNEQKD